MKTTILRLGRIRFRPLKVVKEHSHNFFHIFYVVKGSGFVVLNGELYDLHEGEVHVFHPRWTHDILAKPHADFEVLDLRFVMHDSKGFELTRELPGFLPAGPQAELIAKHIYEIETLGTRKGSLLWQEAAHAYLTIILATLMQAVCGKERIAKQKPASSIPATALKLLSDSLPKGMTIGELADRLFMSPTHLTTLIKAHFGKTAHELMVQLKIEHAKQTLVTRSNPTIVNIAKEYGWKDVRHFRRHFKAITGMTPSTYAKQYRDYTATFNTDESWLVFDDTIPMTWWVGDAPGQSRTPWHNNYLTTEVQTRYNS